MGPTKTIKWQYHKNPEAGSDHQAGASGPAVADSTKADSEDGLSPAKKQNIVSIILSVCRRFVSLAKMWK